MPIMANAVNFFEKMQKTFKNILTNHVPCDKIVTFPSEFDHRFGDLNLLGLYRFCGIAKR